ncbi:MAG TPA: N-acetylmuramidase domain-containing protein [Archangium sp.]|uniref:N-acetylmuramidase domain-containing protein n=1 Tax=Archangium sp. TaxID=1872627 RepID=UPI002E36AA9E|nr:N-acetylmuramidase domain-containing protein [Archangium sp.]HEX5747845.1 N-acetylmuramidase domain-containing protein [Archangium sp.]
MTRFIGAATSLTAQGIQACADTLSVHPAELWAVLQIETRGCGYFADRRPAILFERHVFSRGTHGRFDAQAPDISNPKAGGYASGPAEYPRLEKAMALDERAAMESASWGLGQVMGYHAAELGYGSVEQFVSRMMASEDEQLAAMAAFIQHNGLAQALRNHDWAAFAHGYNGAGYAKNEYDKKLAAAWQHLSTHGLPDLSVREGQLLLTFLGFEPGTVDGAFGAHTKAALNRFQSEHHLPLTSGFDPATLEALRQAAHPPPSTTVPTAQQVPVVPTQVLTLAPRPPAPVVVKSPEPVELTPAAPTPAPAPVEVLPVELLRQKLAQPLGNDVQQELARLLALREKAAPVLGPTAIQSIDLGLTALLSSEQPNLAFVRGIRLRLASALADQLYPLRPLPLLRSSSPATQVVLGLGLLMLVSNGMTAFIHSVLTDESTQLFGLPVRTLLLVGLCGAMGGVVSILMRLSELEKLQGASRTSMVMLGFFKPVIGLYSALFCFALMKSGLLPLQPPKPESEQYLYMAVCFLVGFSERLAKDVFARAEEGLVGAASGQKPAPLAAP